MSKTTATAPSAKFVTLTAKDAVRILGFRTEVTKDEKSFPFVDGTGVKRKFALDKNKHNRPFNLNRATRYSEKMFQGEFAGQWNSPSSTGNGESFIVGSDGQIISCAHRLVGLLLAQNKADMLRKFGQLDEIERYNVPEIIELPALMVEGIDPEAADSNDTGDKRTLGDVMFRRETFAGKELSASANVMLNRELAVATRLVWLRLNGGMVASGGKFDHPSAVQFVNQHPLLVDCVLHVYGENNQGGQKGRISDYISLGYAAAMLYLSMFSNTDREKLEDGSLPMQNRPKLADKAEEFWTTFAAISSRSFKGDAPAIVALVNALDKNRKSADKYSRDALCVLVARAWSAWTDAESPWANGKILNKLFVKDGEREVLSFCRFGGFDLDREVLLEKGWIHQETEFTRKVIGTWKLGDTAWVNQPNGEPWFGTIDEILTETEVVLENSDEGDVDEEGRRRRYQAKVEWLCTEQPVAEEPAKEEPVVEEPKAKAKGKKGKKAKTEEAAATAPAAKAPPVAKAPPAKKPPTK